jgi:hypothetical protein
MISSIYFEEYTFLDVHDVLTALMPSGKYSSLESNYVFRGQKSVDQELIPSVLRNENHELIWSIYRFSKPIEDQDEWSENQYQVEYDLLKNFYDRADYSGLYTPEISRFRNRLHDLFPLDFINLEEEWLPDELLEIAGIAQHYGIPTRLLDWSYDYYVALYFSVIGVLDPQYCEIDSTVWALNYQFFEFYWNTVKRSPLRFFRPSYNGNPFLSAQKGVFTLWKEQRISIPSRVQKGLSLFSSIDRIPLDKKINDYMNSLEENNSIFDKMKLLYKFIIPANVKIDILNWLYSNRYSEEMLFPGYAGVVKAQKNYMKAKRMVKKS